MKKSCITFLISLGVFYHLAYSQNKIWTLKACIDTGIQRNITVKQQQVNTDISKVNLAQAKDNLYPSLGITDAPGFNFGKTPNSSGQFVEQNTTTNSFAITGNVTLYNGLQYQNTIHEDRYIFLANAEETEKMKNDVSLNILNAYMQVLADYEGVNIAQSQLEATEAEVSRMEIYVKAGKLSELNLLQVESQLANDKLAKVNSQNQLLLAKVNLMQLMNIPVDYNFDIVRPSDIDSLLTLTASNTIDIYNTATGFLPQVKSAQLSTEASEAGLKVARSLYYPKLTLSGSIRTSASSLAYNNYYQLGTIGYVQDNPSQQVTGYLLETSSSNNFSNLWNQSGDNFTQFVGLNLTIPIFSNFIARHSVEIAKLNIQNSRLNEDAVKITLRQSIEQAHTALIAAAEQYTASKEALEAEERTFQNMEKKFAVGLETATDYLVEKSNYAKAELNVAQAKYNYLLQVKLVDFYLGKPITF